MLDPLFIDSFRFLVQSQKLPEISSNEIFEEFKFEGKHILQEAMQQPLVIVFMNQVFIK